MTKFVADLHLHSSYARATSRNLNFDTFSFWARLKGINLLASTDFTHPVWWEETKSKLKESASPGFYKYENMHFVLGTEISCIYSQGGKVRRIHCLLYFPEKNDVEKFNEKLGRVGNLQADGRPIVGISAKTLLETALETNEKAILIPAHAWTPWFSLYGSNSGFDSIDEAFGDLSQYIYAIETGLSSDPVMNWRIAELDDRSIVSFSDAHSGPKMSRELTVFESDFSYDGLLKALKSGQIKTDQQDGKAKIAFTIEFFPEEGKYHYNGHRNCGVKHSPKETAKIGIICPNCRKKLTIGVMHRVEELADPGRPEGFINKSRPPFKRLVPLLEILAESLGQQVNSGKVLEEYKKLTSNFGSELSVLLKNNLADIGMVVTLPRVAEGIRKVREGDILIEPGFDGVYGTVRIWPDPPSVSPSGRVEVGQKSRSTLSPRPQAEGQARLPGIGE